MDKRTMRVATARGDRPLDLLVENVRLVNVYTGEIYPAGFLPLLCGRFPQQSVVETYQNHPTFRALRDPDTFKGKCGICEYRRICGGSRARAYAVTGDAYETEPDCVYIPEAPAA